MHKGGDFGTESIDYFNGGLFNDHEVFDLKGYEIEEVLQAASFDWSQVEPSIFGTLFERLLDPAKRSQIGAHYTSREDIETLLKPVMMQPLEKEWAAVKKKADKLWDDLMESKKDKAVNIRTTIRKKDSKERRDFNNCLQDFHHRLTEVSVLDPACGSGNFLYVALNLLMNLEKEVIAYAADHGVSFYPLVKPTQLHGIEINPYAQQLAQVVIWIGYLQWMHQNLFEMNKNPILSPVDTIECKDAILDLSNPERPKEPEWPKADYIVGNPPFLGTKKLRGELTDEYAEKMFSMYGERIPNFSDLCCYWFEKARAQIESGKCKRAGLLATQGIRGGLNREVLNRIKETGDIYFAESDRDWILDGATVHVSMVGFDDGSEKQRQLDQKPVVSINSNLTNIADVTQAKKLKEAKQIGFVADVKSGKFDLAEKEAIDILHMPNPNRNPNSDVVRPWVNGLDIVQRDRSCWIVDFGDAMSLNDAAMFEEPIQIVKERVKPLRDRVKRKSYRDYWWIHAEPCDEMRKRIEPLKRFLVTTTVSKHRIFAWLKPATLPDHQLIAFARSDDYFFGVLHSRLHELWALSQGTQVRERESGFRYTPTTCFETFPFPKPTKTQEAAIAAAAKELDTLRNNWLNPPEWTKEEVLEFPGSTTGPWARYVTKPNAKGIGTVRYPRIVPKDEVFAKRLKDRTLTKLYNQRPTWLDLAHKKLDEAVFAAYGWSPSLSDEEILAKLLALNLERAAEEAKGQKKGK